MPTLEKCKQMIAELAEEKGWGCNVATKIYYAMIELGEAGDMWKHRDDKYYLLNELTINPEDLDKLIAIELIDAIYYCLHALHCLNPNINPDNIFKYKYNTNKKRNRFYADDMKFYADDMK